MDRAPFKAKRDPWGGSRWVLEMRHPPRFLGSFDTLGEAIDHAYKHWPWWP